MAGRTADHVAKRRKPAAQARAERMGSNPVKRIRKGAAARHKKSAVRKRSSY